ncbi:MAG: MerR family transcriptional regulator, partial [Nonlabens sp.]
HDLGLLFLNYELLKRGNKTIYLGASMILDDLPFFKNKGVTPTYITYVTVQPVEKELPSFLKRFNRKVNRDSDIELWILGQMAQKIKSEQLSDNHKVFKGISDVINNIPQLVEA